MNTQCNMAQGSGSTAAANGAPRSVHAEVVLSMNDGKATSLFIENVATLAETSPRFRVTDRAGSASVLECFNLENTDELGSVFNYRRAMMGWIGALAKNHSINASVVDVASMFNVSRNAVYKNIDYSTQVMQGFAPMVPLLMNPSSADQVTIDKAILTLALDGRASLYGIQACLTNILGPKADCTISYIRNLLNRVGEFAAKITSLIPLDQISQGANDEIFPASDKPVMVGIEPISTYIYLIQLMNDRTKESWHLVMDSLKDLGLNLKVSISDAGTGLLSGIREAFPDVAQQTDVFHTSRDLGAEVRRFVDKTYSEVDELYRCEDVLSHPFHKRKKTIAEAQQKIESLRISVAARIEDSDTLEILKGWIEEMVDFSGYTHEETTELINWLLDEMAVIAEKYGEKSKLRKEIDRYRVRAASVLSFLTRLFDELREAAKELGVPEIVFQLAYRKLSARKSPEIYRALQEKIRRIAGGEYLYKIDEVLEKTLKSIKRASSLVENVNSRLRVYMDIKKILSDSFYSLLQLYFNTKKYRRSRVEERVMHSPVELLTHEDWPELIDLFEECGFWSKEEEPAA